MFLCRESEVRGKITSLKLNGSKRYCSKKEGIAQNGVSHIDVKKISDCLCLV